MARRVPRRGRALATLGAKWDDNRVLSIWMVIVLATSRAKQDDDHILSILTT